MAFKLKSGNKPSFKNMGSSPAKQVTREQRLTDSSQSAPADATPRELEKKHKTTKEPQKAPEKQASPVKQVTDPNQKKVISSRGDKTRYTAGGRHGAGGSIEKGKTTTYTKQAGGTYNKKVETSPKGATSDADKVTKKDKTISAKKAERQIARKTKKAERSAKKAAKPTKKLRTTIFDSKETKKVKGEINTKFASQSKKGKRDLLKKYKKAKKSGSNVVGG